MYNIFLTLTTTQTDNFHREFYCHNNYIGVRLNATKFSYTLIMNIFIRNKHVNHLYM